MSTRGERRAHARAAREAAERAERARAARARRLRLLGGVVALAAVVVVAAIALSASGDDAEQAAQRSPAETTALFAGLPQDGFAVGRPDAPVLVEEYADLQCPACAQFSAQGLPDLVEQEVRGGRVRLVLRPLAFIGEDSVRAARFAAAVARQDLAWPFVERFYAMQGEENSGYVTDEFLREVASGVEGLDVERAFAERDAAAVTRELERAERDARELGVQGTPSFGVGPRGGELELVQLRTLGAEDLRGPIEEAAR
jgi:protein-disulfide isomerase